MKTMISQKVRACFTPNFQSFSLMTSGSTGNLMKTRFKKKKLFKCMKDPIFLQKFLLHLSKFAIFKIFIVDKKIGRDIS